MSSSHLWPDRKMNQCKRDDRNKIWIIISLLYLLGLTYPVSYPKKRIPFSLIAYMADRQKETGVRVQIHTAVTVYTAVQRREPAHHPRQTVRQCYVCSRSGVTSLHAISCHLTASPACWLPGPHTQSWPLLVSHAGSWHWNFNKLPEQLNLTLMAPLTGTKLLALAALTEPTLDQVVREHVGIVTGS